MNKNLFTAIVFGIILTGCHNMKSEINKVIHRKTIYESDQFSVYGDSMVQGSFTAKAISRNEIVSNYISPGAKKSPVVQFKFSINGADNSAPAGKDNLIVCIGDSSVYSMPAIKFGQQYVDSTKFSPNDFLKKDVKVKLRVDMTDILKSFKEKGYYQTFDGKKIYKRDFHGVFVAGNVAPLTWDWNNLYSHKDLQLSDSNHDGIYEITLTLNQNPDENKTANSWKLSKDISAFPQYQSDDMLPDALYNLALEEMQNAIEPDSTFRTGKEWAGVWTRDISYSIILSMGILQPQVAMISLKKKVKNGKIIQDTGTGGAYPISTDREIWAVAAWEVYKVTGDKNWLNYAYNVVKNSINDDLHNIYDPETGMVKGESSFLDWREETYPTWMQPADIFESECLGTNAVHYEANTVLSEMAAELGNKEDEKKYRDVAAGIKKGVNQYLWQQDKGYFGQYLYGRNFKSLSPKSEALGEALSIYFGVADNEEKEKSIVENTPVTPFGISCIYPQIPGIPPYHNDAVWPFVESYWALASAKAGNDRSVVRAMCSVYRPAALFLTNKENFVASDGDYAGTQINSSNMLWSLSGNLSLVYRLLFGMQFNTHDLSFSPFVPRAFGDHRTLTNFKYRNAILNIELKGYGNVITAFYLDEKETTAHSVPDTLKGNHDLRIVLGNIDLPGEQVNGVPDKFSSQMPLVKNAGDTLSWADTSNNIGKYEVIKNGKELKTLSDTLLKIDSSQYGNYQVMAIGNNNLESFLSEPLQVFPSGNQQIIQLEKFAAKSPKPYKGYSGNGFVEISKTVNRTINFTINVKEDGNYILDIRYANGNGPINTENKCAFRTITIDSSFQSTLVFPQRGKDEWSNWGWSNSLKVQLKKGLHHVSLTFEPWNENMNGDINQAMLDYVRLIKI
ncbi:MAG: alpha-L-rhamnosidase-related protein [Ginsengibacter sp.]